MGLGCFLFGLSLVLVLVLTGRGSRGKQGCPGLGLFLLNPAPDLCHEISDLGPVACARLELIAVLTEVREHRLIQVGLARATRGRSPDLVHLVRPVLGVDEVQNCRRSEGGVGLSCVVELIIRSLAYDPALFGSLGIARVY